MNVVMKCELVITPEVFDSAIKTIIINYFKTKIKL